VIKEFKGLGSASLDGFVNAGGTRHCRMSCRRHYSTDVSSYDFLNDEAQGANRISGRQNRRLLEGAGEADYDDNRTASFGADEGDFLKDPAQSEPQQDSWNDPPTRRQPPQAFLSNNREPALNFANVQHNKMWMNRPSATPAGPAPKKRGFFKKLWSAVRGRGWR
jgi:hypothetical protein